MAIMMVSSYLPYPLLNGGNIRLYNLLKHLSKIHKITLICEKREYQNENDIKEVEKVCYKVITVDRKKQWTIANILRTGFSMDPFLIVGHRNGEMKEKIKEELNQNIFDFIHVETFYVMQNLPKTSLPIILVEQNVEYLVYKRYTDQAPLLLRPILYLDVLKLKRIEEQFWRKATRLVAVSNIEKNIMNADAVVPNGADIEKFKVSREAGSRSAGQNSKDKTILFIGDFRWIQNKDAITWILKDIWPEIKSKCKDFKIKLWVVSKRIPDKIKKMILDDDVLFDEDGSVDTYKIYEKSDILLSPIRVGGGISFKILEAMASGVPVITTNLGASGIGAKDRAHLLISENSTGFARNASELFENKALYREIAKNARSFVVENYSWDGIAKKLDQVYRSLG